MQVHCEVNGAVSSSAMVDMLTSDRLLLGLLRGWLLRLRDDAFHAVRHGCRDDIRDVCRYEGGAGRVVGWGAAAGGRWRRWWWRM